MEIIDLKGVILEHWEPQAGKCYSNLPNEIYHRLKDWNGSSMLKHALRSVESYRYEKNQPHKDTLALERGAALHIAFQDLIELESLDNFDRYVLDFSGEKIPQAKWLTVKEENPDCYVLPVQERKNVRIMAEKGIKQAEKLNLINDGYCELSFFWIDETTGIKCKCRPDYFRPDDKFVIDYKTTKNHTIDGFPKEIANFMYHFSAATYIEGIKQVADIDIDEWIFIAFANTAPFEIGFYPLKPLSKKEGEFLFRTALDSIKAGVPEPDFYPIDIPFWAITHIDKEY